MLNNAFEEQHNMYPPTELASPDRLTKKFDLKNLEIIDKLNI